MPIPRFNIVSRAPQNPGERTDRKVFDAANLRSGSAGLQGNAGNRTRVRRKGGRTGSTEDDDTTDTAAPDADGQVTDPADLANIAPAAGGADTNPPGPPTKFGSVLETATLEVFVPLFGNRSVDVTIHRALSDSSGFIAVDQFGELVGMVRLENQQQGYVLVELNREYVERLWEPLPKLWDRPEQVMPRQRADVGPSGGDAGLLGPSTEGGTNQRSTSRRVPLVSSDRMLDVSSQLPRAGRRFGRSLTSPLSAGPNPPGPPARFGLVLATPKLKVWFPAIGYRLVDVTIHPAGLGDKSTFAVDRYGEVVGYVRWQEATYEPVRESRSIGDRTIEP